jgi:hypothetical protein
MPALFWNIPPRCGTNPFVWTGNRTHGRPYFNQKPAGARALLFPNMDYRVAFPKNVVFNDISSLDVSKLTSLKELDCGNNPISSIDVSNNSALEILTSNLKDREDPPMVGRFPNPCITLIHSRCFTNPFVWHGRRVTFSIRSGGRVLVREFLR